MKLERAGKFLANLVAWRVKEFDSGAIAIGIEFSATDELFGDEWSPMSPATVFGDFWVVGKTGAANEKTVKRLAKAIGWDGRFASVTGTPPAVRVRIVVEPEDYKGKTSWKVRWIDPATSEADDSELATDTATLDAQFGSKLQQALSRKGKPDPKSAKPAGTVRRPGESVNPDDIPF